MKENDVTIEGYLNSINNSIETIRNNKTEITAADIPSDFKLSMTGAKDSKIINFIFDTKLDRIIDNLLNKLAIGSYDEIDKYSDLIKKVFEAMGIGEGAFTGPISQMIMSNITTSLNSIDLNMTKHKVKKILIIIKNLKKQAKTINDKETKRKYIEAVKALKQVLRLIAKVYKNRRIITNRIKKVKQGLHYAVNESIDYDECLERY